MVRDIDLLRSVHGKYLRGLHSFSHVEAKLRWQSDRD
jgi:hypothetical protein